ncbi:hypothetical protein NSK_004831 [Nannochloropsis salina CCMP1776]|uniref:Histone deacetylase n=1 Tax=Nannochloropsis salina CCMP1776 TaxID=1027361 RepID=A0A4D9CZY5_9STRA|nr:hypothetical protein NSK_004831 [Nannochloropsis salina CCMP1776]|eukprot:TFJ83727.1 hypothetical protein NSK_004831 [Nannochloropsis salina CCMP1776]
MSSKKRVSYFYHGDVGHYYYGPGHPMKPHRLKLTHHLVLGYGLYRKMEVYRPHIATTQELQKFHSQEYVNFLSRVNPDMGRTLSSSVHSKFNVGEYTDCPIFDGMMEFCKIYTGCSIDGAQKLNHKITDVAVNWSGGLHHAKKGEASGFCYINDIVLAILELLKYHPRVLYIDIDIHHGDGVEEAFYCTDRVMTVSFHRYGDFFPGTGNIKDVGAKNGKHYSVNVPLEEGIDDASYERVFRPVMAKVMEVYQPSAVVLQCGADSLSGDRLGCFNLTLRGHAKCVEMMKGYNVPLLILGGGGYAIRNVARCWAFETSVLLEEEVSDEIPRNDYYDYYAPDYKLHLPAGTTENQNSTEGLEAIKVQILQQLSQIPGAPSVQMQEVPPDWATNERGGGEDEEDPDVRSLNRNRFGGERREHEAEFYEGGKDQDR